MRHQFTVTWQHIRRSPYQAAAAVMIMTLTMFVGLSVFLISLGSDRMLSYLERRPRIIAFFNDKVTSKKDVQGIITELEKTSKTASVKFVSKDQALEIYRSDNKNDPLLLELVSANTLPTSLEISAKSVADLPQLHKILKKAPNLEDISYQKDVINNLIPILDKIRKFGIILVSFLVLTTLFTIVTIIGMKISLRKDEIEVERLVGASKWYIRAPFLLEGIFYGLIGGVISWAVVYLLLEASTPQLAPFLSGLALLPVSPVFMLEVLVIVAGGGALVGALGSALAVRRYLKN